MKTELGKIKSINLGHGGYQDSQIGLNVNLGGEGWHVSDFISGGWLNHTERTSPTGETYEGHARVLERSELVVKITQLLNRSPARD